MTEHGVIPELSLLQKLLLKVQGYVFIRLVRTELGFVEVYLGNCKSHGLYLTHPAGFYRLIRCPDCLAESYSKRKVAVVG